MPNTGAYTRHVEKCQSASAVAQRDKMKSESKHHKTSSKDPMGNDELLPHAVRTALMLASFAASFAAIRASWPRGAQDRAGEDARARRGHGGGVGFQFVR